MRTTYPHRAVPLCAAGILFQMANAGPARAELVGQWLFDEGSGTTYADSSPAGNDAYIPAADSGWLDEAPPTAFANESSYQFNGSTTYVETSYGGIGGDSARTVAFWVKVSTVTAHGLVAWGDSVTNGAKWHLRLNNAAGNGPVGAIRTETQGDFTIGTTPLADGQWHHVASVYPGGGELGTVIHYVDGVAELAGGNNASTQAVNTNNTTADPVTVGRRTQGAADNYFDGAMDDVRIYDRALSDVEVAALFDGAAPPTDGLVLYYDFEEGTGDTVADAGTGMNDGAVLGVGAPAFPVWSDDAPPGFSHSLEFLGGDMLFTDYIGVGGSTSRSVTFWFKTTSAADNGIVAWGDSTGSGLKWHARINSNAADGPLGALRVEIQDGRAVATTPANDGGWHHGAIVFEEDLDPDITDVVFYLDGEPDDLFLATSVPINTLTPGGLQAVTLGGRVQGANRVPWLGNLADVRIYDTGLTQAEVQTIMAGGGAGGGGLRMVDIAYDPGAGEATFTWSSRPGRFYVIQTSTDGAPPWDEVDDAYPAAADAETTSFTVGGLGPGTPRMLFRVGESEE